MAEGGGALPRPGFSFARVAAGTWLAYASYGVLIAVLPFAELDLGGGPLLATLVLGAPLASQTLASYGWGWWSDRRGDRRRLLVAATALEAPLFLLLPLTGALGIFAIRVLQSALFGSVVLATTVATEEAGRSAGRRLGWLQFASNGGMLLGVVASLPLLGGASFRFASSGGWALVILLAALTLASAAIFALSGDLPRRSRPDVPAPSPRFAREVPELAVATAAVATFRYMAVSAVPVYLAATLAREGFFGLSINEDQQLAVWLAVSSVVNLAAAPVSGRLAEPVVSRRWTLVLSAAAYAAIWVALYALPNYAMTFGVWIVPVAVFFTVAGLREAADASTPEMRGRAVGLLTAAFNFGGLAGAVAAGVALSAGVSLVGTFGISAVGAVGAALLWVPVVRRLPDRRGPARTSGS